MLRMFTFFTLTWHLRLETLRFVAALFFLSTEFIGYFDLRSAIDFEWDVSIIFMNKQVAAVDDNNNVGSCYSTEADFNINFIKLNTE